MIFDPIPKKNKYRTRKIGKPKVIIEGSTGAAIKNISVLEDALPTNRDYRTLNRMQMKFLNWRKLESGLDESDGEAMGEMLMANSSNLFSKNRTKKMREQRVKNFFEEFHAMRTMKIEHPFFEKMIQAVIEGGKEEKRRHRESKLAVLTVHDGNHLGASFKRFLGVTATEEGAFASWVKMHPAMNELSLSPEHKFFKPLMLTIGKCIRHSSTKMKLFISVSASLASMLDVTGDLYTIWYYSSLGLQQQVSEQVGKKKEKKGDSTNPLLLLQDAAILMTVFVALSFLLQILLVVAIHRKNKRQMLVELLQTFTFTKQGFNFWRTYTNAKMRGYELVPPVTEMMLFQSVEVFAECIPMAVIQVMNILNMANFNIVVVGALFCSTAFVSEAVSYMTYIKDISEESRRTGKIFYGFVPLRGVRLMVVRWR